MDTPLLSLRLPGEDSCIEFPAAQPGTNTRQIAALIAPTRRNQPVPISFYVTSFFVRAQCAHVLASTRNGTEIKRKVRDINIPLMFIESCQSASGNSGYYRYSLEIKTKHVWTFVFGFSEETACRGTEKMIQQLRAVYLSHTSRAPAFDLLKSMNKALSKGPTASTSAATNNNNDKQPTSPSRSDQKKKGNFAVSSSDSDEDDEESNNKQQQKQSADPQAESVEKEKKSCDDDDEETVTLKTTATTAHQHSPIFVDAGWTLYDEDAELLRQISKNPKAPIPPIEECGPGKDLRRWFHTTYLGSNQSRDYGYSPTYPTKIVVPNAISDGDLMLSAEFRSRQRVPAISFVHFRTGAVLGRSSQPMLRQSEKARFADATILRAYTAPYEANNTKPMFQERGSNTSSQNGNSASSTAGANNNNNAAAAAAAEKAKYRPPPSLFDDYGGGSSSSASSWDSSANNNNNNNQPTFSSPVPTSTNTENNNATTSSSSSKQNQAPLFIVDLRPSIAAKGNLARGGGWEVGQHYEFCEVSFAGIENIFAVINSFAKLRAVVDTCHKNTEYRSFYQDFEATGWLQHIHRILRASCQIVELLEAGKSVHSHCTDGWDRTAQCTSLAMMMIDPYYRTIRGFCILVEKEFCSFGHQFAERLGHQAPSDTKPTAKGVVTVEGADGAISVAATGGGGGGHSKPQDPSPIFLQWLDSVFQVVRQFPSQFEFTPVLLEILAIEIYSCLYGTFLCDHMKQRIFDGVRLGTRSIWSAIDDMVQMEKSIGSSASADENNNNNNNNNIPAHSRIVNALYDRQEAEALLNSDRGVNFGLKPLHPSIGLKRLAFWESLYLRFDPDIFDLDENFDAYPGQQDYYKKQMQEKESATPLNNNNNNNGNNVVPQLQTTWKEALVRREKEMQTLPDIVANYVPSKMFIAGSDATTTTNANFQDPTTSSSSGVVSTSTTSNNNDPLKAKRAEGAKECWSCGAKFGFFKSMVVCAMCGGPFCSKCAPFTAYQETHGCTGQLCVSCHALAA